MQTGGHESVLLADVGGTNVRFALADVGSTSPLLESSIRRYRVAEFSSFEDAARRYLVDAGAQPTRGVFAVAGPVTGDEVRMTNHPWVLSRSHLQHAFGFASLRIVNDFAAMSHCVPLLAPRHMHAIGELAAPRVDLARRQTFAVIGPGTGLGVGALLVDRGGFTALETEGGHVGFAPGDETELDVLRQLMKRFGRVSAERLLCGSGLVNLHAALHAHAATIGETLTPESITSDIANDPRKLETVQRFCAMLGSIAGDFALAFGAWDGVFLAGGLTPKLLDWLAAGAFRRRFEAKGRYERVLARVPTIAILHADPGLLGAAALAVIDAGAPLPLAASVDEGATA
jgi:glucokinase